MGWRFRKSFKVAPGVRLNIGKKGISTSIGPKGAKVNIGPNGTRFTASIPGTGLSYTTRLDKPIGKSMTQCPYCGHKMRKQWDNCPKCHQSLIKKVEEPENNISADKTDDYDTYNTNIPEPPNINTDDKKKKPSCLGCGCLILIIFFILGMIGSCASGTKEDTSPKTTTPAVEETTSQNSSTDETTENEPNNTTVDTQTTTEQQSTTVEETSTPVAAPSSNESNNTTTATNTSREVNHYYGEGPNGETIKGNINSKGEKIYHVPGGAYYIRTDPEAWFFTEEEARAAGYRPSKR